MTKARRDVGALNDGKAKRSVAGFGSSLAGNPAEYGLISGPGPVSPHRSCIYQFLQSLALA